MFVRQFVTVLLCTVSVLPLNEKKIFHLRSTMGTEKLNISAVLNIRADSLPTLNCDSLIDAFVEETSRRKTIRF